MKDRIINKLYKFALGRVIVKTLVKVKRKLRGKSLTPVVQQVTTEAPQQPVISILPQKKQQLPVEVLYRDTGNPVHAIPTVVTQEKVKRLNLVTDTIEPSSLLGGVATALIVATIFCEKNDYELRIITRTAQPNAINYNRIIEQNQLKPPKQVTFFSDYGDNRNYEAKYKMDISADDIFFATSWWSAEAIRKTTIRRRFFYIIQEVETFFYNYNGERLMCEHVMQNHDIDFIVNSHYLDEYFRKNDPNIAQHSVFFEPAFSRNLFHPTEETRTGKHRLFFYGRPRNPRNLFNYGVNILDKAIQRGIIDTQEWEICFAGAYLDPVTFCDGTVSKNLGQMTWKEYASFLQTVDLALSLMYTPHPSYPPFDVACSGGVVVTNKYLNKQEFPQSRNVLMAELTEESLMKTLEEGIRLALDTETRKRNYEESTIPDSWEDTLEDTLRYMEDKTK